MPKTKYRMVLVPQGHPPEEMEKLVESMSEAGGWIPVTFVPHMVLPNGRISGHLLMARIER